MASRSDSAGAEKRYLLDMLESGGRTLEIGCGDGRLTWQYADLAAAVIGIDVTAATVSGGLSQKPHRLARQVSFLAASAVDLPFPSASFDHAVFSHSF